nr:unnamed protein product [Digitaria exilis]
MVEEVLTDGGDGGDDLAELELVEDGGLTSGIKTDHEDPHLLLGEEAAEQLPEREPHLFLCQQHKIRQVSGFQPTARRSTATRFDSNARHPVPNAPGGQSNRAHPTEILREWIPGYEIQSKARDRIGFARGESREERTNISADASVHPKLKHAVAGRNTAPDRRPGDPVDQIRGRNSGEAHGRENSPRRWRTPSPAAARAPSHFFAPSPPGVRRSAAERVGVVERRRERAGECDARFYLSVAAVSAVEREPAVDDGSIAPDRRDALSAGGWGPIWSRVSAGTPLQPGKLLLLVV